MQQSRDRESAVSRKIPSWKKGQMTKMRNELNELRHDKMYSTSLSYLQLYNLTRTRTHNWQEFLRKRGDMNLGPSIARRHLQALDLSELQEICYDLGLPAVDVNVPDKAHTKFQQLLMAMLGSCFGPHAQPPGPRLRYEELQTHMLKQLCEAQGLPSTGKRPKLLELLVEDAALDEEEYTSEEEPSEDYTTACKTSKEESETGCVGGAGTGGAIGAATAAAVAPKPQPAAAATAKPQPAAAAKPQPQPAAQRPGQNTQAPIKPPMQNPSKTITQLPVQAPNQAPIQASMPAPQLQGKLVALCVGVSKYARSPLHNPVKDAKDMAAQLQKRGIDTMMLADPDLTRMTMAINEFLVKARGAELAVCFFAGHGAYSKAAYKHILLAADDRVYPLEDLVEKLEAAGSKRNLVLVDACRAATGRAGRRAAVAGMRAAEEDFNLWGSQRVVRDSLMRSDAVRNSFLRGDTLLCHACSKLQTAKDGTPGKNGVFTGALLKHLFSDRHPNLMEAIEAANDHVKEVSRNEQVPKMEMTKATPFTKFTL